MNEWILLAASVVFWTSALLLVHSYAVYPFLLSRLAKRREEPSAERLPDSELPEVGVLMSAYNEEAVIEATLDSILASDYPTEKLTVWVGSDGSTDDTHQILHRFKQIFPQLRVVHYRGRNGKIRIVNHLARKATAEFVEPDSAVFVLCDANVVWDASMLRRLVARFREDQVGLVAACVRDRRREHEGIGDQEETYIGLENSTKYAEGVLWGNMMGAFGACYAMRAALFTPVPETHVVDDFYQTMQVIGRDKAAIVELDAVCYEAVSTEIEEEFRRKRRIATGNFQNFHCFLPLFLPWSGGLANSFAFWSHKGIRWLGPIFLLAIGVSCLMLAWHEPFYRVLLGLGGVLLAGCAIDAAMARSGAKRQIRPLRFLRYFLAMNAALFSGMILFLRGPKGSVWEPTRRVVVRPSAAQAAPSTKSVS